MANDLPFELLVAVFHYLAAPQTQTFSVSPTTKDRWITYFDGLQPTNVTKVSRHWREAALQSPSLWATWYIDIENPPDFAIEYLRTFVRRALPWSSTSLLTFRFAVTDTVDQSRVQGPPIGPLFQDVVDAICREQYRWEDVVINLPNSVCCNIRPFEFSALRELQLHALHQVPWPVYIHSSNFRSRSSNSNSVAPMLQTLDVMLTSPYRTELLEVLLGEGIIDLRISFPQLNDYDTDHLLSPRPPPLLSLESPRVLELAGKDPRVKAGNPRPHAHAYEIISFLKRHDFPGLNSIILHDGASLGVLDALKSLLHRCRPPLTSLSVDMSLHVDEDCGQSLADLLRNVPSLVSLQFKLNHRCWESDIALQSMLELLSEKDGINGSLNLVPQLQDLMISGIVGRREAFITFITSRWITRDGTLRSVLFDECHCFEEASSEMTSLPPFIERTPKDSPYFWRDVQSCVDEGLKMVVTP